MRIEPLKLAPTGSTAMTEKTISPTDGDKTFGQFLSEAITDVNELQQTAHHASIDLAAGKVQDIAQVMVASEKATVALQLTMQVRNKVVDAYQEIMRMQM